MKTLESKSDHDAKLQRKIFQAVKWANRSPLGCKIRRVKADAYFDAVDRIERRPSQYTNIQGTAKDGKAIYIQYILGTRYARPPKKKRLFMQEMEALGAIVGSAYCWEDVWDIIKGGRRWPRTYSYREKFSFEGDENDENTEVRNTSPRDADGASGSVPGTRSAPSPYDNEGD